jgi:hypothetical protein
MKRTMLIGVVAGFAAIAAISQDAFARNRMYNPSLGRWMQRDPAGTKQTPPMARNLSDSQFTQPDSAGQYADGPNLYQYVRSNPITGLDPSGQVLVVLSGAGQSEASMNSLRNATKTQIEARLAAMWPESKAKLEIISHGKGELYNDYDGWLRNDYNAFLKRKRDNPCSLEQFLAIGHSSGASAISNEIVAGTFKPVFMGVPGGGMQRVSPIFFGLVDQILGQKDLRAARVGLLGFRTAMIHYKQPWPGNPSEVKGVLNITIFKDHFSIVNDAGVVKGISEEAASAYASSEASRTAETKPLINFTKQW